MDKFHKIFVNKVKDVFDNHNEAYHPEDWEKLQQKMDKKRSRFAIILPYIAKAAVVVIFLVLSIFITNKYENNFQYLKTAEYIKTDTLQTGQTANTTDILEGINKETNKQYENINISTFSTKSESNDAVVHKNPIVVSIESADNKKLIYDSTYLETIIENNKHNDIEISFEKYIKNIEQIKITETQSEKAILNIEENDAKQEKNNQKRFGFGVEIASVSSYSNAGLDNTVNVGAGLSASYRLFKNIRFSTGMLVAKQSLNYLGNPAITTTDEYAENSLIGNGDFRKAQVGLSQGDGFNNFSQVSNVRISEQKRAFITVDIPLNLVYQYKNFSFTSGVSSLLCLNEKQENEYDVTTNNYVYSSSTNSYKSFSNSSVVNQKVSVATNHFDFAQLVNLSVGYGIDLKKGHIVLEPYVKVPIGRISSQDIVMGAGGLALRYNFFK